MRKLLIYIACCVVPLLDSSLTLAISTMFVALLEEYGESRATTATVQSILVGTQACSSVVTGILIKQLGVSKIAFTGSMLLAGGFILSFFSKSIVVLDILIGFFSGIGVSFVFMSSAVIIRRLFAGSALEIALSIQNVVLCVGAFVYPYLLTHLTREYGVKGTFLIVGGLLLNNIPISIVFHVNERGRENKACNRSHEEKANVVDAKEPPTSVKGESHALHILSSCKKNFTQIASVQFFLLIIAATSIISSINGYLIVLEDIFAWKGISDAHILSLFTVFYISTTLGSALPIVISITKRGLNMAVLLILLPLCGCAGQLLTLFTDNMGGAIAANILMGLTQGGTSATATIIVANITAEHMFSVAVGMLLTMYGVFTLAIGPFYGFIWDTAQSYNLVFMLTAVFNGIASVSSIASMLYTHWKTSARKLRIAAHEQNNEIQSTYNTFTVGLPSGSSPGKKS